MSLTMTSLQKNALTSGTPSSDWTTSTKNPVIFFAGASPIDYMLPYNPSVLARPAFLDQGTDVGFDWQHQFKGVRFAHSVTIGTSILTPEDQRNVFWRAVCHYLVDAVPEQGLEELTESVASLYGFYLGLPSPTPARPAKTVQGAIDRAYQRPVVDIAEE